MYDKFIKENIEKGKKELVKQKELKKRHKEVKETDFFMSFKVKLLPDTKSDLLKINNDEARPGKATLKIVMLSSDEYSNKN